MRRTSKRLAGLGVVGLITAVVTAPAVAAPVVYEAESATITSGVIESTRSGYTGSGYVNSDNVVGASIEFTVTNSSAGSRTLAFRYANGVNVNRPATLTINGTTHSTQSFPGTRSWTTWVNQTATATLPAGTSIIRITSTTANGLANVDSLTVDDGTGGGGGPIANPIPQDPIQSGLGLVLTEWAQFPQSSPTPTPTDSRLQRHARINYLGELPDGRRFVPDLNGRLYFLGAAGGTPSVYLDVRATVGGNFMSGRGLGSGFGFVAFHPQFATNGKFYTVHSETPNGTPDWTQSNPAVQSIVTEWTAANPSSNTFSGTRRELLRIGFGTNIHAIQQIDFNPNATPSSADYGLLYVAVGDGGRGSGSGNNEPQTLSLPFGKLLRINPAGNNSANRKYGIPPGNPFVGQSGRLGEIYAYGYRDPHRFSWDRGGSGKLFLGHIGEHDVEAVYDVRAGDNMGWPQREGSWVFNKSDRCNLYPLPANDATLGYDYPVAAYDHDPPAGTSCTADVGRAVVGGFVYRGTAFPALQGKYIFGDLVQGWVFYTNESQMVRGASYAPLYRLNIYNSSNQLTTLKTLAGDNRVDLRLGIDRAGDLYLMAKANGKIWKVTGVRGTAP
ncbi:PQQ-dependent sugar dehydrogenase [Allorhizocola rhizosphaerae]|uniref:PQQ-dependent sugar dehydrogenase n=1 Tax=Allorhizocola rhizosphaerae TaxID=1872709 RepID=UPI000E3BB20D|nr:PQQ-dependent sugar dehydrogenase [Allorhizocola rhizosphaerae]